MDDESAGGMARVIERRGLPEDDRRSQAKGAGDEGNVPSQGETNRRITSSATSGKAGKGEGEGGEGNEGQDGVGDESR